MKARQTSKYLCYITGVILYFLAFLGTLIFPSLTYLTYLRIARRGFLFSLFLTIIAIILLQIGKKYISISTIKQMASIYYIISAIFLPMFIRSWLNGQNIIYGIYNWIELVLVITGLFFWTYQLIGHNFAFHFHKDKFVLLLILATVIALSIEQLGIVIKGDSVEYYSQIIRICHNFTFNPNDISLLKSSGHCCYSYSLFSTIGENIFPYFGLGVRIQNIVIWILCIIFAWKVLQESVADISQTLALGCVACFAFTPLILGNIQEISVEIYVLLFFILFVYSNITKKHILEAFFAVCFVFAKEPDILILAGYYLGLFINQAAVALFDKRKYTKFLDKDFVLSSLSVYIAVTVFCLYFAVDVSWGSNASFDNFNMTPANTFGINSIYIISKLKQLFILNFSWIATLVIIIGYVLRHINKRTKKKRNLSMLPLVTSYVFFLTIQLFYLTFVLPRYIMLQAFYLFLALVYTLHSIKISQRLIKCLMLLNTGIILIQNFYNIDLVSYIIFDTLNTGSCYMIFDNPLYVGDRGEFITRQDGEIPYIQPYGMTNKQFSYFDKLLELALKKVDYSDNDLIVLPHYFNLYPDNFYWGNHLPIYYFDTESKSFVQLVNEHVPISNTIVKLQVTQIGAGYVFNDFNNYHNIYYFDFSFSDEIDKWVYTHYQTKEIQNIKYRGWTLTIYKVEDKN